MGVNYITAKLRKDKFESLLKDIENKAGVKARSCNSIVGGCVFFAHAFINHNLPEGMTPFEMFTKIFGKSQHEAILMFMNAYYQFLSSESMNAFEKLHRSENKKK